MYTIQIILKKNTGNNSFSFDERVALLGKAEITLPSLKTIKHIDQIKLGTHVVLEEIDEKGTLHSCTGLEHIYKYKPNKQYDVPPVKGVKSDIEDSDLGGFGKAGTPIYIFDNHNHALYFWIQYTHHLSLNSPITLLHIDQHSDLNIPPHYLKHDNLSNVPPVKGIKSESTISDLGGLRTYTNHTCQISTFINPFLHLYPQTDFTRIKSESQLLTFSPLVKGGSEGITILDIDLDFRAPEMSIEKFDKTIRITRQLIYNADLITIATSPMFLDQSRALALLHHLLD